MTVTAADDALVARIEAHRVELTGYCYRMLGSASDADDAVQETMVRAWRHAGGFQGRSSLRAWLYRIATNVCLATGEGRGRRALPVDLGPAIEGAVTRDRPAPPPGRRAEVTWIEPVPDHRVLPATCTVGADPAEQVVARESIRLAFVAALQYLPPRQRAVLILREVLRWPASEVAVLLGTTVVSVNSALQRARAGMARGGAGPDRDGGLGQRPDPAGLDDRHRALLARYVDAFERFDIDELVALLHEDVVAQMPPAPLWFRGREALRTALAAGGDDQPCRGSKLVPVAANGSAAFAQYRPNRAGDPGPPGGFHAWALQVVEVGGGLITTMTSFVDAADLFPRFGLPVRIAPGAALPTEAPERT